MKKKSHILLTGRIACRMFTSNDSALLWGSILPDLLFFTYIRPHTWQNSRKAIFKKMRRLSKCGFGEGFSALRLGYILHYIEDFFTYAHNKNFDGSFEDHIAFENEQARWIVDFLTNEPESKKNINNENKFFFDSSYTDIEDVISKLEELHEEYMLKEPGIENDVSYAARAVAMVCRYYVYAFAANEKRLPEFLLYPNPDYIVDIPGLIAKICAMTHIERGAA